MKPQVGIAAALLGVVAFAFAGAEAGSATATTAGAASTSDVIVVGAPQLLWSDVDATNTPALWDLASRSALGSLSVKAADPVSCPDDGWLTLGAGNRAAAGEGARCADAKLVVRADGEGGAAVDGFAGVAATNSSDDDNTHLGALADTLRAAGQCVSAAGPRAALAAAGSSAQVGSYVADPAAAVGQPSFLRRCPVTLVSATASNIDDIVARAEANAPSGATLLVLGVADFGAGTPHLQVALAHGGGLGDGGLVSASTRRAPFVQLVDVAPTILALRGLEPPSSMIGQPWHSANARSLPLASRVKSLARLDLAARRQVAAVVPFWGRVVVVRVAASCLAWWLARRARRRGRGRRWRVAAFACAWAACLPAASFLAGVVAWWAVPLPLLILALATVVAASALTAIAHALEVLVWQRRPLGLAAGVGVVTCAVIGLDLVSGAHLQIFTMAGYSPLVAGRFAGIGNVGFGVFAAGALLAAAGLGAVPGWSRGARAGVVVGIVGLVAVAVDGAPPWGSDVGGVLALAPAFAVLAWLVAGARVSWKVAVGGIAVAVGVVVVFAVVDYARPPASQTHLGRFVGDLLHGGAWAIVRRKALADVHLLTYSVLTLLIPLMVVVAAWLLRRPGPTLRDAFARAPALRPALVATMVMSVLGAVLNDSGIVIPALAVLVTLPATMAVVASSGTNVAQRVVAGEPNDEAAAC